MKTSTRARKKVEFGDFQTPIGLARAACHQIKATGFTPGSIVEPSCGIGNMLLAAADAFPTFGRAVGVELQPSYVSELARRIESRADCDRIAVHTANFFEHDWPATWSSLPDPLLVIGNPPWVTNTALSSLGSSNLPEKSNFQRHSGLDALTGKSNFDISEAMLLRILDGLAGRNAMIAVLCKTAVARKVLAHGWKSGLPIIQTALHRIDSMQYFGAAVDACLFVCRVGSKRGEAMCPVFETLPSRDLHQTIGFRDGQLIADVSSYERWRHLEGEGIYRWRSGIKHDCADVVELTPVGDAFKTQSGEILDLEPDYLFPLLKASDLGNGRGQVPRRWMLVTQRFVGDQTASIAAKAPRTWTYLQRNADRFNKRASVIYRNRPAFSMFGIGEYSFSDWKVGIAGLYKKLDFRVIGPHENKPIVLDDTCYFLACQTRQEADFLVELLNSREAQAFYSAQVFWDAKRPVTVDLLSRLDLRRLAAELKMADRWSELPETRQGVDAATLFG